MTRVAPPSSKTRLAVPPVVVRCLSVNTYLLFKTAQLAGPDVNVVFGADVPDNLQRSITFLCHFETLPTGNLAVLRPLENLLVQFLLFHNYPFLSSADKGDCASHTTFQ